MPSPSTSPRDIILHRRTSVHQKRPLTTDIQYGELAVAFNQQDPAIYLKDLENKIRKVGGVYYSEVAPDPTAISLGYQELSHGEIWLKKRAIPGSSDTNTGVDIYIWNKYLNSGSGDWVLVGSGLYGLLDDYLDQFKDGTDGSDYIHTDRNQLKINNKSALRGYATNIPSADETDTTKANTLVINDGHNFATGVTLNANNLVIDSSDIDITSDSVVISSDTGLTFQTDSVTGTPATFTYNNHGLFNGEKVFVLSTLSNGDPSPLTSGEYTIADADLNSFKLFDGSNNVPSSGNIRINYFPQITLDSSYNVIQSGNFKVKDLDDTPDVSQIADGTWDVYKNTTSGNIRVYARSGNTVFPLEGASAVTLEIKNGGANTIAQADPVYFTGVDPIKKRVIVEKADAANSNKMRAIGLANSSIPAGQIGIITIFGELTNLNTSAINGGTSGDDSGKTLYVKPSGGLSLTPTLVANGIRQPVGILVNESATEGRIFVNHPNINESEALPSGYIWIGSTQDTQAAYRLNTNNFQTFTANDGELEVNLNDEITFGAYGFRWDGDARSKIQTKVDRSEAPQGVPSATKIDSFSTTYRSAKFFVQASMLDAGGSANHQITELLVIHNGTDVSIVDYGTASVPGDRMGDFSASIDTVDNEVDIFFTKYPTISNRIEIKVVRTSVLS
ncbi:virion structural protein and packaging [Cyanophage S-TIM5]|uniref:Virion structural protein and packaging n=1 Tax=Cyanophage S-TIM5 TaxID=1137745 RepID=H6WFV5_9CAUD|nr:virion structural protein and packaging [Cyanophage S-TIM5]AEZ65680.1 virion structural protein and packaging [Cyanophage S-TIM5]UYE97061.1 virion structural protein [Cyanophage S-TIM61]